MKLKRASSKSLSNIFFDVGTLSGVKHVNFDGLSYERIFPLKKQKCVYFVSIISRIECLVGALD